MHTNYNNAHPNVFSAEACADLCRSTPDPSGCQKWTWTGTGTDGTTGVPAYQPNHCFTLQDSNFDAFQEQGLSMMVSGLRFCPVRYGECFEANVGYGRPYHFPTKKTSEGGHYVDEPTATADLCQAECQAVAGCLRWTWIDPNCFKLNATGHTVPCFGGAMPLGSCIVYHNNYPMEPPGTVPLTVGLKPESSEGCISGPPKCPCDGTIKYFFCAYLDELVDNSDCYSVNPDNGDCEVEVAFYCPGRTPEQVMELCDCGSNGCAP